MHAHTGSKDGSVVFARVGENKLSEVAEFSDVLEGHIVKCCRWREEAPASAPTIFACGGNNHTVRLVDVREGGGRGNGGTVLHAADSAVSFVQWCPADQNILMSCSHDTCIKLWDIRAPRAALHSLQGHHQVPRGARVKGMHRASFFAGGRYVVTTGEKTNLISIYNVATGVAVSRGNADGTGTSCAAFEDGQGCVVAVASASQIALYTPLPSHE
jgi:WD40 repeat protein